MRTVLTTLMWLTLAGSVLLAIGIWRGDESFGVARVWERVAGPPDLGAVDFSRIARSPSGNDALFCPPELCGGARVDGVAPVFAVPVSRLRDAVRVIEVNDPDIFALARDDQRVQDRYLARTRLMRFPDTINVRFIRLGPTARRSPSTPAARSAAGISA